MCADEQAATEELRKGQKTRQQILAVAADVASADGLEGLTIGSLAKVLGMSKSGLYAHFGSKEELQLAVVDLARQRFEAEVLPAVESTTSGIPKLYALILSWADSIDNGSYRGGCFFAAASAEFDDRPGPVRDEIARLTKTWIDLLEDECHTAKSLGHFKKQVEPTQITFEFHAFVQEANWAKQLLADKHAFGRAKKSICNCLERAATAKGRKLLPHDDFPHIGSY